MSDSSTEFPRAETGDGHAPRRTPRRGGRVSIFVTCVVDQFRPGTGRAVLDLLEACGYVVEVPDGQACCGQPAYSAGHPEDARRMAIATVECLANCETVVMPSGSCAAMVRNTYPKLLAGTRWEGLALAVASATWEFSELLALSPPRFVEGTAGEVTFHDSCHGLRMLGLGAQARSLLTSAGYQLCEMSVPDVCCGFGGVFSSTYPELSLALADDKLDAACSAASLLAGTDIACLLHLEGRLKKRQGMSGLEICHLADLLARRLDTGTKGPRR